ncbi:Chaperone protein DnaK [Dirofilaria immitis]
MRIIWSRRGLKQSSACKDDNDRLPGWTTMVMAIMQATILIRTIISSVKDSDNNNRKGGNNGDNHNIGWLESKQKRWDSVMLSQPNMHLLRAQQCSISVVLSMICE